MLLTKLFLCLVLLKLSSGQLDGEFWWLNDKVKQLKGIEPPLPNFEELSEFDTDESSKIIFRDEDFPTRNFPKVNDSNNNVTHEHEKNNTIEAVKLNINGSNKQGSSDEFIFNFPDDKNSENTIESVEPKEVLQSSHKKISLNDITAPSTRNKDFARFIFPDEYYKTWKNRPHSNKQETSENKTIWTIPSESLTRKYNSSSEPCTFMNKWKCHQINGHYITKTSQNTDVTSNMVCCILRHNEEIRHKIVFPISSTMKSKRVRRSSIDISTLMQRNFLLRKKFGLQTEKYTATNPRIVSPEDDYVDPYLNIKSSNFKTQAVQRIKTPDCNNYHDYTEDYVAELPKPGLVGIYSDHAPRLPSWTIFNEHSKQPYGGSFDYSYEDEGISFGYSTIDPRKETSKGKRPLKRTTSAPQKNTNFESQTLNFQSNPNFNVLQGFKLLNLGRNRNKFYSRNTKRSTTEASVESDSNEFLEIGEEMDDDNLPQIYKQCGKITVDENDSRETDTVGDADYESHPWIAVVVSSMKPQTILCYATIVHPRAAITTGDCVSDFVNRNSEKEIKEVVSVISGLHNLKEKSETQTRVAAVQLHPKWKQDKLAHNLAILHWTRPLRINEKVRPACLSNSVGSVNCKIFGWAGFDQALRQHPSWQHASVISSQDCGSHMSKAVKIPSDAFCVAVQTRGTVTGLGGSLVCTIGNKAFSTGVAVYRDRVIVLIPAQKWIIGAMKDLNIQ